MAEEFVTYGLDEPFPGYDGRILPSHGFISEILNDQGYNTFGIGKWHLSVATEETMAGPFNTWPLRRGFERFLS